MVLRSDQGLATRPAFNDDGRMNVVERSYELAMTWVWGERPTLEDCLGVIKEHAVLL